MGFPQPDAVAAALPAFPISQYGTPNSVGLFDEKSIQSALNAAAGGIASGGVPIGNYGGKIILDRQIVPGFSGGITAVKFPSKGTWFIEGLGPPPSDIALNDGGIGQSPNKLGVQIPGTVVVFPPTPSTIIGGNAFNTMPTVPVTGLALFDATTSAGNLLLTIGLRNITFYQPFINLNAFVLNPSNNGSGSVNNIYVQNCEFLQLGAVAYNGSLAGTQPRQFNISSCVSPICTFNNMPQVADIFDNYYNGETLSVALGYTAGVLGTLVHIEGFDTLNFHNNTLVSSAGGNSLTQFYACLVIRIVATGQTEFGVIESNHIYGCNDMFLYYKNDHGSQSPAATIGIDITNNHINGWNIGGYTAAPGAVGSAMMIDTSIAANPEQMIRIGGNTWVGGNQSGLGTPNRAIELAASPLAQNIMVDWDNQIYKQLLVSCARVNGTEYGPVVANTGYIPGRIRGRAVLGAGGTITVAAPWVTAATNIKTTVQIPGGTQGFVGIASRVVGTSFTIASSNASDTSTVMWEADVLGVPF